MRLGSSLVAVLGMAACAFEGAGAGPEDPGTTGEEPATVSVSGTIVDFETGEPIEDATLTTMTFVGGEVAIDGSTFEITGVRTHVAFHLLVSAPGHHNTVSDPIAVGAADVRGVELSVVSSALVDAAIAESEVSVSGGVAVAILADADAETPEAGVSRSAFGQVAEEIVFLDPQGVPDRELEASSEAGVAVLINVPPGILELESAEPSFHFSAQSARVERDSVTVMHVAVGGAPAQVPAGVSFSADIMPIFERKGCNNCHQADGEGRQVGGFSLMPPQTKQYQEVSERVDTDDPASSLILRKPSFEDPPDGHDVVFTSDEDPDYLLMLGWIMEGALDN